MKLDEILIEIDEIQALIAKSALNAFAYQEISKKLINVKSKIRDLQDEKYIVCKG